MEIKTKIIERERIFIRKRENSDDIKVYLSYEKDDTTGEEWIWKSDNWSHVTQETLEEILKVLKRLNKEK